MIETTLKVDGNLLGCLDMLDRDVKSALKDGVQKTAQLAYNEVLRKVDSYGWNPPNTTGNLRSTVGYLVRGGGKYNIFNYNATRSLRRATDNFPLPPPPPDIYSAVIFCLASYGSFVELGTGRRAATPFFYDPVTKAFSGINQAVLRELDTRGITGDNYYTGA